MTTHAATAFLSVTLLAGCAGVVKERGHDRVAALVERRIGMKTGWDKGPPDDARVAEWVRSAVARGLTRSRAVEIALVNNPELAASYEELGISQADMVQAGLLRNPALGAEIGFGTTRGQLSELRFSLVQDFLDLFVLPLRKQIAREQFEADTLRVAHAALGVAAEAEKAVVALQASAEVVTFRRALVETAAAGAELADRQLKAGNISQLVHATERATFEQAKLDLAQQELQQLEARETVNRLLGLWGGTTTWRLSEPMAALPASEPPLERLESLAVERRLDLASARMQAALLSKAVDLARSTRLLGRIEVGVDFHRDPDGPRVIGPNLVIDLPLFDQRQAYIARLEAQRRQHERRLAGMAIDVRSQVRLADARLRAARQAALLHRDTLVPMRTMVVDQSLLHYNGMFIGLPQLLAAKQAEVDARRGHIEAARDYWMARVDLAHALGGALPAVRNPGRSQAP